MTRRTGVSRRKVLQATGALATATVFAEPLRAAAPPAESVTPELLAAARKEGKVVWYAAMDLHVSEHAAQVFEAKYPGVKVRIERTGSERQFQRLAQEYASNISAADVIQASDAAHFIVWKRNGWLAPYVPEDVAKYFPPEHRDPDGQFATVRFYFSSFGYNTNLVKPEDAPKSFADLLDPKWKGKLVKAHPGYSGTIMTATFQIARDLGWEFFEKLAQQRVMQVQSAVDPPKKLALGERAVMADGNDYNAIKLKESGQPVEVVYPSEGAPLIVCPNAVLKRAPNPNAARLFQNFLFSVDGQQVFSDFAAQRSAHPQVKEKAGRIPLSHIKAMKDDPAGVAAQSDAIKAHYTRIFKI
jgi:iron(III) transport system substrate-binding protein